MWLAICFRKLCFVSCIFRVSIQEKADVVMARVLDMQDEFIRRANRPDGKENKKRVKEYYCKLRADLQTEINAIATEIGELSK